MDRSTKNPGMHEHSGTSVARVVDMRFNPRQPRDWRGRWVSIGGGKHQARETPSGGRRLGSSRKINPSAPGVKKVAGTARKSPGQEAAPKVKMPDPPKIIDKGPQTVRKGNPEPIKTAPKGPDKEAVKKAKPNNGKAIPQVSPEEQARREALQKRIEQTRAEAREREANRAAATQRIQDEARKRHTQTPVSSAFDDSDITDNGVKTEMREGLRAIDSVHKDGVLPRMRPKSSDEHGKNEHGHYQARELVDENDPSKGVRDIDRMQLSPDSDHKAFTFVHESGHLLDQRSLGRNRDEMLTVSAAKLIIGQGSDKPGAKEMAKVLMKALESRTVRQGEEHATLVGKKYPDYADYAQYYTSPAELWARVYAQYIATKSQNPLMMRQLRRQQAEMTKRRNQGQVAIGMVWPDQEFARISPLVDDLMRSQGWM